MNQPPLSKVRKEYGEGALLEAECSADPFDLFQEWFDDAVKSPTFEPNAMVVATVAGDGQPSQRVVLLKEFSAAGFTFFTNYSSQKGSEIDHNPKVSLLFFWEQLERQVRISGMATKIGREKSVTYFNERPKEARVSAIVSQQSKELANRNELEDRYNREILKYESTDPPCPSEWGGYIVTPVYFEFWQGRKNRLHDRISYRRSDEKTAGQSEFSWSRSRLSP